MTKILWMLLDLLKFYRRAVTVHRVDSPSLYQVVKAVQTNGIDVSQFENIESHRKQLLRDRTMLDSDDLGAPSQARKGKKRTISQEVAGSSLPSYQGRMLSNLVAHRRPKSVLELGTSFGIGTAYLHTGFRAAKMITIEGNQPIAENAEGFLSGFCRPQVAVLQGLFQEILPSLNDRYDFIFIDGDHRLPQTLHLLKLLRPKMKDDCLVILHDIHWSAEMTDAWKHAVELPWVTASVDFYHFGILLTSSVYARKEHLHVVSQWLKPWQLGIMR